MTSATVLTTVPFAALGWSQSRNAVSCPGVVEYSSQSVSQMWWNTNTTQPPPLVSAWVTYCCIVANVVVTRMSGAVLMTSGSRGGIVSANGQVGQRNERIPPTWRADV